jgi:pimeloyl-ACP methyl ester carboxylesterase
MKYNAYIVPGFAADDRMFKNFNLDDCNMTCLNWGDFNGEKSYADYAKSVIIPQIKTDKPIVLIGFSMGGMVVSEIANLIEVHKLIFIASAKNKHELPRGKVFALRVFRPHSYMNQKRLGRFIKAFAPVFKFADKEHQQLVQTMIGDLPDGIVQFGLSSMMRWDKRESPKQDFLHIHGDKDKLLGTKRIKDKTIVSGGHFLFKTKDSVQRITELVNNYIKE